MKIHEYQAKELLKQYDVPVLFNKVIFNSFDVRLEQLTEA